MGSPRAGSNPAGCEIILICFLTFFITLFFRVSNRKQKISLDCPDYAKTNTWYRHKNKSPSPPKSEPNRGSQKRYFIVSIAIIAYTHMHWRQTGLKSGGAEWEFETYLVKIRDLFSNTRLQDQKNSRCT